MNYTAIIAIIISFISLGISASVINETKSLGSAITTTASSDTLETFRTNVNASLTSLQNDKISTTTTFTWTALQSFFGGASTTALSGNTAEFGGTATTTITSAGRLGIASTSPLGQLGVGTSGATSTVSTGRLCAFMQDSNGRGMWLTLSISGNTVFSTSTAPCNI